MFSHRLYEKGIKMKLKKFLSLLMAIIMLLTTISILTITSSAIGGTVGDYKYFVYNTSEGCAEIDKYTGTATVLSIPSSLGGYKIDRLNAGSFRDRTTLVSVTIPSSVKTISCDVFEGCTSLKTVKMSNNVSEIFSNTFQDCVRLSNINLSNKLVKIDDSLFWNCKSLKSIKIPIQVTSIGKNSFWHCSSLETITIPKSVTYIGKSAFQGCSSLKTVNYGGTISSWKSIIIESIKNDEDVGYGNNVLINAANINCNGWAGPTVKISSVATGLNLSWSKVSSAKGYLIYRKTGSGSYSKIASTTAITYTDKTAKAGTKYYYAVRAYNGHFRSAYKEVDNSSIMSTPATKLANTSNGIKVSWNKISGANSYNVYRKTSSGSYSKIATTTSLSYVDKTAKAGTKYIYAVRANLGTKLSGFVGVGIIRLTTPSFSLANTKSGPKITWSKVTGSKGYLIYRKTSSGSYSKIASTTSLSYVDKTAKAGTKYTYTVKAYNGSYASAYTGKAITVKK